MVSFVYLFIYLLSILHSSPCTVRWGENWHKYLGVKWHYPVMACRANKWPSKVWSNPCALILLNICRRSDHNAEMRTPAFQFYFLLRKWIYLGSTYNKNWPVVNEISVLLTKRQDPQKLAVFGSEVFCTKKANFLVRSWTNFANFIDNLLSTVPKKLCKLFEKHIYRGPEKNFANFINNIFNTRVKRNTVRWRLANYPSQYTYGTESLNSHQHSYKWH